MAVDCETDLGIAQETPIGVLGHRGSDVLRIVGEALTNARRYSGTRHVRVTARGSERGLCVEVTDDGRGLDPRTTIPARAAPTAPEHTTADACPTGCSSRRGRCEWA
jgi:anti-sigma regulatory factor (Ser/Thr protein kinase)